MPMRLDTFLSGGQETKPVRLDTFISSRESYEDWLKKYKVTDADRPDLSRYDYKSAYEAGVVPKLWETLSEADKQEDIAQGRKLHGKYMFPDEFKTPGHPFPPKATIQPQRLDDFLSEDTQVDVQAKPQRLDEFVAEDTVQTDKFGREPLEFDLPETVGKLFSDKPAEYAGPLKQLVTQGINQINANIARIPAATLNAVNIIPNLALMKMGRSELKAPEWLMDNPLAKYFDKAADYYNYAGKRWTDKGETFETIINRGDKTEIAEYLGAQLAINAPTQIAIIAGSITFGGLPTLIVMGAQTAAQTQKASQGANVSESAKAINSLYAGTIEAAFEQLGTLGILKKWGTVLAKSFGRDTAMGIMKNVGKTVLHSFAGEANEEVLTSFAQDFSAYATGVDPQAMKGSVMRAAEAGIVGGLSGATMTAPGAVAMGVSSQKAAKGAPWAYPTTQFAPPGTRVEMPPAETAPEIKTTEELGVEPPVTETQPAEAPTTQETRVEPPVLAPEPPIKAEVPGEGKIEPLEQKPIEPVTGKPIIEPPVENAIKPGMQQQIDLLEKQGHQEAADRITLAVKGTVGKTFNIKPEVIKTDVAEMQLRDTPFSQETVNSIKKGGWDEALYSPIPIVERNGEYYVAGDGHSRLEAYNQLKREGKPVPDSIEFKIVTEQEAQKLKFANLRRTQLKPLEETRAFTELVDKGKSTDVIAKDFGISETYVKNILSLAKLSTEMKSYVRDKILSTQHAFVLGKAVQDYGIPEEVQNEIFHKFIKVQEVTPNQLRMFLDKIGAKVAEQISLELPGVSIARGLSGALNDIFNKIKEIEKVTGKKEFQSIIKAVDRLKKKKQEVPAGILIEYQKIKDIVDKANAEIDNLTKGLKFEKPTEPTDLKISEKKEPFYQMNIDGKWEKVAPFKKKAKAEPEPTLWTHLAKPTFDVPVQTQRPEEMPEKQPTQSEMEFQVEQKEKPPSIIDSQIDLYIKEKGMMPATSLKVTKPEDIVDIFYELKNSDREKLYVVMLDKDNNIIGTNLVSVGTLTASLFHIREFMKPIMLSKARKVVMVHNHPSGNVNMSGIGYDETVFRKIEETCKMYNVSVPYHIIIDDVSYGIVYPGASHSIEMPYKPPETRPLEVREWDMKVNRREPGLNQKRIVKSNYDMVSYMKEHFDKKKPSLYVLSLSSQNSIQAIELVGDNTILDNPSLFRKKVLKFVIMNNASCVIIVHNLKNKLKGTDIYGLLESRDVPLLDIVWYTKDMVGNLGEFYSAAEHDELMISDVQPGYVSDSKIRGSITRLRERIGIPTDKFNAIKLAVTNKTELEQMTRQELLTVKKVLQSLKVKVEKKAETAVTIEKPAVDLKDIVKPTPDLTPEQAKIANNLKARIGIVQKQFDITPQEAEQIKIRATGWSSVKNAAIEDLHKVLRATQAFGEVKIRRKQIELKAKSLGMIKESNRNLFNRFLQNYFAGKKFDELTMEELNLVMENLGKLTPNYRGTIVIPRTTRTILQPQQSALLGKYKMGIGHYIWEFYEYLKLFDIDSMINNIKELYRLAKDRALSLDQLTEAARRMLPLEGNDLRYLDKFGLYNEIGKPLEQAGYKYRELMNQYIEIIKKWNTAAMETKEGKQLMFEAADGPFTQAIRKGLTPNQIKAVEEWFQWRDYFAEKFKIKEPLTNYIHHIIEETAAIYIRDKYPFPTELYAIMEYNLPKEIYAGFMEERLGFPFIKRDFVAATSAYFAIAAKKLAYDDALNEIKPKLTILEKGSADLSHYIEEFIGINILGRTTKQAEWIANSANSFLATVFGQKTVSLPEEMIQQLDAANSDLPREYQVPRFEITPGGIKKLISNVKLLNYLSVIGLNIRTTLVNLTQVTLAVGKMQLPYHQRGILLAKSWAYSFYKIFSPSFWREMKKQGILEEMERLMELDSRVAKIWQQTISVSMMNMKLTEFINRVTVAKLGAEQKRILAKGGKISVFELERMIAQDPDFLKEAKMLDKEFSDVVNYLYGPDYTAPTMMTPLGRCFYHLNSFATKYTTRVIMFARETQLGGEIEKLNKEMAKWQKELYPNEKKQAEFIKFVQGLPPQKRSNLLFFLLMATGVGYLFGDYAMLTLRAVGLGTNSIFKMLWFLVQGEPGQAWREFAKSFIPLRGAYKRIQRVSEEGIEGMWRTGKIKKQPDSIWEANQSWGEDKWKEKDWGNKPWE